MKHGPDLAISSFSITSAALRESGLAYVYLGYWVEGSARMQYKVRYRPIERLTRSGWERIAPAEHDRLIARCRQVRRDAAPLPDGSGKDGVPGGQEQYRLVE